MVEKFAVFDAPSGNTETPLLQFANGKVKKHAEASDLKIRCYYSGATQEGLKRRRMQKILVAENKRLQYTGYNFGPNALKTAGICRFYVGIHDKLSGKIRVVPSSLFHMKPHLGNEENVTDMSSITNRQKRDQLTVAFGSKKKRRTIESRASNLVHEDSLQVSAANIVQETKEEKIKPVSDVTVSSSQPDALPPKNEKASVPEEVYDIDNIILKEEYDTLLFRAEELCTADDETVQTWKAECKFSSFVLSKIRQLRFMTKIEKVKAAVYLLYFDHLVTLLNLRYAVLRKKDPLPDVPDPLKTILLEKFTCKSAGPSGKVSRSIPQKMKDKILAYALIVALHVEKFSLDLASVQMDLKVPQNRVVTVSYALGCHVLSRKTLDGLQTKTIELKIPLFAMNDRAIRRTKKK